MLKNFGNTIGVLQLSRGDKDYLFIYLFCDCVDLVIFVVCKNDVCSIAKSAFQIYEN